MLLHVMEDSAESPDPLAEQAPNLASHERPTIAERAARVDWARVDEILARVPNNPPLPGDEK
jgi:hypothetical protein